MKIFFYQLKNQKKDVLIVSLIMSLLLLASFSSIFLPQLVSPTILSNSISKILNSSEDIEASNNNLVDFSINAKCSAIAPINQFNVVLETSSNKIFGLFDPIDFQLFASKPFTLNNDSAKRLLVLGVTEGFFSNLTKTLFNSTYSAGSFLMTKELGLMGGNYNLTFSNHYVSQNISVQVFDVVKEDEFQKSYSNLCFFLNNYQFYERYLFVSINDFVSIINQLPLDYQLFSSIGYINFSNHQEDIMYWSINSESMINDFKSEIVSQLSALDTSIIIHNFIDNFSTENIVFVSMVYSLIRVLQVIIWSVSIVLAILNIFKVQRKRENQELYDLISGRTWIERISGLFLLSLFIVSIGIIISLIFVFPFVYLQKLFNISLEMNNKTIVGFSIVSAGAFTAIFSTYLDFEFYIRRKIRKGFSSEEYKVFSKVPRIIKLLSLVGIVLVIWLMNKTFISIVYFIILFAISLVISSALVGLIVLLQFIVGWIVRKRNITQDKPFSSFSVLFKLWRKQINSRFLLYSLMFSLTASMLVISSFTADATRTQYLWSTGSEIDFTVANNENITLIEEQMDLNPKINDFTRIVYLNGYYNNSNDNYYGLGLENNLISFEDENFTGNYLDSIIGINPSDYIMFFQSWNRNDWVEAGSIDDFPVNSSIISKGLRNVGYSIDDNLSLFDEKNELKISGYINIWPTITDQKGTDSVSKRTLIMDIQLLQLLLDDLGIEYQIRFKVHTSENDIHLVAQYLEDVVNSYSNLEEMSYLDSNVFLSVRMLFLKPLIVFSQIMLFIFLSLFVHSKLEIGNDSHGLRSLSIIALSKNHRKTLAWLRISESFVQTSLYVIILLIVYFISRVLIINTGIIYNISTISLSGQTIFNLFLSVILFSALHGLQSLIDILNYRKLDLSKIYRHPE